MTIKNIRAYEIIDSRGLPTIEARLILSNDTVVKTSVPSGTSVGKHEALELRDGDISRFDSMGVLKAVSLINDQIGPKLKNISTLKQKEIDNWLISADGTKNKSKLGGNTTLTISQLVAKAGALTQGVSLFKYLNELYKNIFKDEIKIVKIPTPIFNIINGGKHANNNLEFQEFQVIPSSSFSFEKSYRIGVELYHELKKVLEYRNTNISVGEEGGFAPNFPKNIDSLEAISETISRKRLRPGADIFFGMDIAASHFFAEQHYKLKENEKPMSTKEFIEFILNIIKQYSFIELEDPLNEDDFKDWAKLNALISKELFLVGDDLLATNRERLSKAIKEKACNAILIKPNQIGTITETLDVVNIARKENFAIIVSHRSGETNDDFIADFGVAVQSDFVKFGAPSRGERVAKYNRLWQIEKEELK